MTRYALVVAVILKCSPFFAVISECSTASAIFLLTSLLCSLYWPWDPLPSLGSTPVSIVVTKQVDCNKCRFSKLFLIFFFLYDGSDRLMKQASFSYIFLCVVLAATYLKCHWYHLPFVWNFLFIVTHTHTRARSHPSSVQLLSRFRSGNRSPATCLV